MTAAEALQWLEQYQGAIAAGLVILPAATYLVGLLLRRASRRFAGHFLALAIHLAVVPGISMAVLILYLLFFVRAHLLNDLHLVIHVLPVVSMAATLWAASRIMAFDDIPGFRRIEGLMLLVGLSFAAALAIQKTRLGILFLGRLEHLFVIVVAVVALWKLGAGMLSGANRVPSGRGGSRYP